MTVGSLTFTIHYNVTGSGDGTDDVVSLLASGARRSDPCFVNGSPTLNGKRARLRQPRPPPASGHLNTFVPGYIENTGASNQHSMVESVVYSFAQGVTLSTTNFSLTGLPGSGTTVAPNVVLTPNSDNTVWTVTFSGTGVNTATHSIGAMASTSSSWSGLPGLTNNSARLPIELPGLYTRRQRRPSMIGRLVDAERDLLAVADRIRVTSGRDGLRRQQYRRLGGPFAVRQQLSAHRAENEQRSVAELTNRDSNLLPAVE